MRSADLGDRRHGASRDPNGLADLAVRVVGFGVRHTSISALQLQRETGLRRYETAWTILHKVRAVLSESRCGHDARKCGGLPAVTQEHLPKVHLLISNLKTWLRGTFHGVSDKHLPTYAREFIYRFNRRHLRDGQKLLGAPRCPHPCGCLRSRAKPQSREGAHVLPENKAATAVVDASYLIHTTWGPGLLESAYSIALEAELRKRGHRVAREVRVPVVWNDVRVEDAFRIDLVVDDCSIVELKSVEHTARVHKKQVITYLKLTGMRLGLLVNFGEKLIKDWITRLVNGMPWTGRQRLCASAALRGNSVGPRPTLRERDSPSSSPPPPMAA